MNQQNYDQQQIQNLNQQLQQIQYQVQQQQIHNPNQQRSQQIQNYGQENVPSDNSLPVITSSPFQAMSSNSNIGDIMTIQSLSQPSQQQQSINNQYSLNLNSNFNNNHN